MMAAAGILLSAPIPWAAVMLVETCLVITVENGCLVVFGAGFNLFLGQIDVDSGIGLDHVVDPFG